MWINLWEIMGNQLFALEELDPELFGRMHGILLGLVSQEKAC